MVLATVMFTRKISMMVITFFYVSLEVAVWKSYVLIILTKYDPHLKMYESRSTHTMSMNCQYHAVALKTKCCLYFKSHFHFQCCRQIISKVESMITWMKFNTVARKNVHP